jgi:hypothetical protein
MLAKDGFQHRVECIEPWIDQASIGWRFANAPMKKILAGKPALHEVDFGL